MSVKLEAYRIPNAIVITNDSFEYLLNCLDNQKFVHEVNADGLEGDYKKNQKEMQDAIDNFNIQCRELLHGRTTN
jgi:hypothetical protein